MFWIFIITLAILGLVAAAKKIEMLVPASKQLTDFLQQSEGWIGIVSVGLSIYWLVSILLNLVGMLKAIFFITIMQLVSVVLMFLLGMLLAQTLIKTWTSSNEKVSGVIDKIIGFASPLKETMGLLAVVLALLNMGLALALGG